MGKNKSILNLGKFIGNTAIHQIAILKTNKPESVNFLIKESDNYRNLAFQHLRDYNWNQQDKEKIKAEAVDYMKKKRDFKYSDMKISDKEIELELSKVMQDLNIL